jgi:hypothetical protein
MVTTLKVGDKAPDGSIYRGLSKDGRHIYLMAQEGPKLNHYDAMKYAADLNVHGHKDWVLPGIRDADSLTDAFTVVVSQTKTYDPNAPEGHWLSPLSVYKPGRAWLVQESTGEPLEAVRSAVQPVRCIRYE